jgi:hypothetical protein
MCLRKVDFVGVLGIAEANLTGSGCRQLMERAYSHSGHEK